MDIKVGYRQYRLNEWSANDGMANQCFGKCDTNTAQIFVDFSLPPEKRANTAIHECLHAIWSEWALDDKDDEERIVRALANGLTQILRDNPDFAAFITNPD